MVSKLVDWCSYRVCDVKEQKDAMPRIDALIAPALNEKPYRKLFEGAAISALLF